MAGGVMGVFQYEDDLLRVLPQLRDAGFVRPLVLSPVPLEHELEHVYGPRKSPVRRFSLVGALTGAVGGFAMAVACALVFILPVDGRPVIPFPPFLVISYETTILLGVLFTLLGFHIVSGLPAWQDHPYDERLNVDRFGVIVPCADGAQRSQAERLIRAAGAEDVREVEDAS
jgi:molybdopterin-containing oxidoreductase family membrane subunit